MLADSLDGRDLLPFATGGEQRARHHGNAIHQHGAGAAGRIIAAALRARELQLLPQHVEQKRAGLDGKLVRARPLTRSSMSSFFIESSQLSAAQPSAKSSH